MCTVNERADEVRDLSLAEFRRLLDQMPDLQQLHLQGLGEPMLNPEFFDMVELATARGIEVSSNSNLTLLTPARARRCVTSGLVALSVSIDGASRQVYEQIRRKASFAKVIRNLDRLVEARSKAGSALAIRGVMVLMRSNLEELPDLVRLLNAHGVGELLVQRLSNDLAQADLPARYIPIRNYVQGAELGAADERRAAEVFAEASAAAKACGLRLHLPRLAAPASRSSARGQHCRWPWEQLYVSAAGELMPCCMVASADRGSFGKVLGKAAAPLAARWHGETAQAFRLALESETPPAVCRSCALYRGAF
jgi:MoaA/NifB/PqqE/SkfB family radical SAM enzyme